MATTFDALLTELFGSTTQPLARQCAGWLGSSRRFRAFAETYRDKIRRKAGVARDEEARRDLECELETAYLLLQAKEFAVAYEQYTQLKQRGPDFTVTYKTHTPVNVEVKRLRAVSQEPVSEERSITTKLLNSISDKLGQMPPSAINVLTLVADGQTYGPSDLGMTMSILKDRTTARDEEFFVRRGFLGSRDYQRQQQRLSAILVRSRAGSISTNPIVLWTNPEAKHVLTREISNIMLRCMTAPELS
jgi:hypothetical protein